MFSMHTICLNFLNHSSSYKAWGMLLRKALPKMID